MYIIYQRYVRLRCHSPTPGTTLHPYRSVVGKSIPLATSHIPQTICAIFLSRWCRTLSQYCTPSLRHTAHIRRLSGFTANSPLHCPVPPIFCGGNPAFAGILYHHKTSDSLQTICAIFLSRWCRTLSQYCPSSMRNPAHIRRLSGFTANSPLHCHVPPIFCGGNPAFAGILYHHKTSDSLQTICAIFLSRWCRTLSQYCTSSLRHTAHIRSLSGFTANSPLHCHVPPIFCGGNPAFAGILYHHKTSDSLQTLADIFLGLS